MQNFSLRSPVETVVYENQQGYYDALAISQKSGDTVSFIEFMLSVILQALEELPTRIITDIFTDIITDKLSRFKFQNACFTNNHQPSTINYFPEQRTKQVKS